MAKTVRANASMATMVKRLWQIKAEQTALAEELKSITKAIILREEELTPVTDGEVKITATIVRSNMTTVDEGALHEALTVGQWNRVTVRRLDKTKLEVEINRGSIDVAKVAECTAVTPKSPYILVTTSLQAEAEA